MNRFLERFKALPDKKRNIILSIIGVIALVLLVVIEFSSGSETPSPQDNRTDFSSDYTEDLEKKLKELLEEIDGAGKVDVMITLESCYENVYAKSYDSRKDGNESEYSSQITEEYIVVKSGSDEECLVVKVYEPAVKGVAVAAEGADNIKVKTAITETVCALFDISSNKVSVIKKYEE